MTYPASTFGEAVVLTTTASNQFHQIINEDGTTSVPIEDGSLIPTVRKALLENFYFKDPIAWSSGATETVFNQLRSYTDGTWWYAPTARSSTPVTMSGTPVGDTNWKLYNKSFDLYDHGVNVKTFGYIGDGTYHPLSEWISSGKYLNLAAIKADYPKVTSMTQSIDWAALQTCADYCKGQTMLVPKGIGVITDTVVIPTGTIVQGVGKFDIWNLDTSVGAVITTYGSGNAQRWTDITGSDLADDTPMFVAGGNGVYFIDIALKSDNWSIGLFYPCVKQCGFERVQLYGFTDACCYLDATWSDRNTVLTGLHSDIATSTGMNEFSGTDFYFRARGAGAFAIKIQGTTRSGTSVATATDWLWGWGGTSDVRFNHGRLSAEGALGGCYSHDVQLFGATSYGQGISFVDTSFRLAGNSKYYCKFDRSARHLFYGSYGETGSPESPVIAVTSNTIAGNGEIILLADDMNGQVEIDGVLQGSISSRSWQNTRTISRIGADGRLALPGIHSVGTVNTSLPLLLTTFHEDGLFNIGYDDGATRTPILQGGKTFLRPEAALGVALGTNSYPWSNVNTQRVSYSSDLTIDPDGNLILNPDGVLALGGTSVNETFVVGNTSTPVIRPITDGFASLGTTTYPWLNVRAHNLFSDSGAVSVSDERLKTFAYIEEAEKAAAIEIKSTIRKFKFNKDIERKGIDGARWHFGVSAQFVGEIMRSHGLNPDSYGFWCYDEWEAKPAVYRTDIDDFGKETKVLIEPATEAGNQYGIRYDELAMFILSAMN